MPVSMGVDTSFQVSILFSLDNTEVELLDNIEVLLLIFELLHTVEVPYK